MNWRDDIIGIIEALRPPSLLAVMPADEPLWGQLVGRARETDSKRRSATDLLAQGFEIERRQLTIVAGTLECLNKRQGGHLVARLRDLYSEALYVVVPMGHRWGGLVSYWTHGELLALALRQARQYLDDGKPLRLYHYDIYDYKLTPDWLNSRHWANPRRWDKDRW